MIFGGIHLATKHYHSIFWHVNGWMKTLLKILTFIVAPFHPLILLLKIYHIELKLRNDEESPVLRNQWDELNYHICHQTKFELGMESFFQLTLQVGLLLLAKSREICWASFVG